MTQQHKKKRRRKVQPRFYVIVTIFILLILTLIGLLIWLGKEAADKCAYEREVQKQQEARASAKAQNPEGYDGVDYVPPSWDDYKNGATMPPQPKMTNAALTGCPISRK